MCHSIESRAGYDQLATAAARALERGRFPRSDVELIDPAVRDGTAEVSRFTESEGS